MVGPWIPLIVAGLVGGVSFLLGYLLKLYQTQQRIASAEEEARRIKAEAETEAKETLLEAKSRALEIRDEAEAEMDEKHAVLHDHERRLRERSERIDQKFETLDRRMRELDRRKKELDRREHELETLKEKRVRKLEEVSGLTREEARQLFLELTEKEARQDAARVLREVELETKEEADRKAREIIATAVQRVASEQVSELTSCTVSLPDDEMKGRIIGRNGRNIRAMEKITGVDIIVDDTPEVVTLSSYDPVRREIARVAMKKLVMDGRIHPAHIEEIVEQTREEVDQIIREAGEEAVYEAGVTGLHPKLIKLLGRLKFRTSYGQNVLDHAVETAHIAAMLAAELGANVDVARKAALLHDIGKAVSHEVDGPHALIGADIAKRHGVSETVRNAIASHHHEAEQKSVEAILVESADAISGARPGARRESLESYLKRIKALEDIAKSFEGVEKCYAIQAGREIRIMVKPGQIDDLAARQLSKRIANKVEESLEYPGQIKVTVIRETRAVDYAM